MSWSCHSSVFSGTLRVSKQADESQRDLQLVLHHLRLLPEQSTQLEERSATQPLPPQHLQAGGERGGSCVVPGPVITSDPFHANKLKLKIILVLLD